MRVKTGFELLEAFTTHCEQCEQSSQRVANYRSDFGVCERVVKRATTHYDSP